MSATKEVESTVIQFTNDEWCQIHMAVLARRESLHDSGRHYVAETMNPIADKIVIRTRNFHGTE